MPENMDHINKYNNPENGLELSIKNYGTDKIIDPAKVSRFKVLDIKEYILKMPYSNKKAVSFFTHIDNPEYTVVWISDNKLEQMVHKFVGMYISIRDAYPEQSTGLDNDVNFIFEGNDNPPKYISANNNNKNLNQLDDKSVTSDENKKSVKKSVLSLYDKTTISEMLKNRNKREISFDNEFFNVYIKKIKLENGVKGTKIVFDSNYNFSWYLPAIINQTRVNNNENLLKIKFENMQIVRMLRDFLKYYVPLDKMSMASDENVLNTPENMRGFSMN